MRTIVTDGNARGVLPPSRTVIVVVGDNDENRAIIRSTADPVLLVTSGETADNAAGEKVPFIRLAPDQDLGDTLAKFFKDFIKKSVSVIINTGDDNKNLVYVEQIAALIEKLDLEKYSIDETRGLKAYAFGEPENASAFERLAEKTNGCVRYINKYKLIATDFVDRHPLTEFMTDEHIDYKTASLRRGVNVSVVMIGFCKTSRQLFLASVANNQFYAVNDGKPEIKLVSYHIYDKKDSRNRKSPHHNYYRFVDEIADKRDYLPLPPKPAREEYHDFGIGDTRFYDSIKQRLETKKGETNYTYVVIAFGTDTENLDLAEKITAKLKEWKKEHSTKMFVNIRDHDLTKAVSAECAPRGGFIPFGDESQVVYSLSQIVGERTEVMARGRHLCYALQSADEEAKAAALTKWLTLSQIKRESNIYACLSIRLKLHLLGFDYCPVSDPRADASAQFMEKYQTGDPIVYGKTLVGGRQEVEYPLDFIEHSVRRYLAEQEHLRWNAYMITCGFVPSTIAQITAGDSKNFAERRHGNLTTFEGLIEYRKIEAARLGCSEKETDVIRYDYQLLDDLVWLLSIGGYKIVAR